MRLFLFYVLIGNVVIVAFDLYYYITGNLSLMEIVCAFAIAVVAFNVAMVYAWHRNVKRRGAENIKRS